MCDVGLQEERRQFNEKIKQQEKRICELEFVVALSNDVATLAAQAQIIKQQAQRIKELEEWQTIVLGTGTDQEAVIRMAATEYTKIAVQSWREKCEQQAQEMARYDEIAYDKDGTPFAAASAWRAECDRKDKTIQTLREALADVTADLRIVLPMAKGYAHEHPVGSNADKVNGVETVIVEAQRVLEETR